MIDWNLGDILDAVEPAMPQDAPALIHGDRIVLFLLGISRAHCVNAERAMVPRWPSTCATDPNMAS